MANSVVTTQPEFFRAQAATMREQAEAAVLGNVRARCLCSAHAGTEMAERAGRHRRSVARTAAAKAEAAASPPA